MKIHEYQARDLLSSFGIPVPPGVTIESPLLAEEAYIRATKGMASPLAVIKAQVHAGGRGKAGFVKLVRNATEAKDAAQFMLTNRMISPQTPPEGLQVKKLLVAAGVEIADRMPSPSAQCPVPSASPSKEEFYLAITTDRATRRNILIASREGGVEIEQVAHDRPEAIIKQPLHPTVGLQSFAARKVAYQLGLTGKLVTQAADIMVKLAKLFVEKDCSLAEINPLVIAVEHSPTPDSRLPTPDFRVLAIDAKFNFDDNGLFRHPEIEQLADPAEENAAELRAKAAGLSYVALEGNIGCLVNGAGLAMATMDIIKLHGGQPANFLDVGGGASEEAVTEAFHIILSDQHCKGILVNIFGGIMRCDIIAQGVVNAAKQVGFKVPLVVRLEGTNVDAGRKILNDAKSMIPTLQAATDLTDAATKVCKAVAG
ncbi:MAG: ADP-forming succinate--CoA ligase subunit beta [Phycisphaerales bacterium]|nr:ADP-forming succinate--CoA ligase subunit beta [Phycisphaerales bacterium]